MFCKSYTMKVVDRHRIKNMRSRITDKSISCKRYGSRFDMKAYLGAALYLSATIQLHPSIPSVSVDC